MLKVVFLDWQTPWRWCPAASLFLELPVCQKVNFHCSLKSFTTSDRFSNSAFVSINLLVNPDQVSCPCYKNKNKNPFATIHYVGFPLHSRIMSNIFTSFPGKNVIYVVVHVLPVSGPLNVPSFPERKYSWNKMNISRNLLICVGCI